MDTKTELKGGRICAFEEIQLCRNANMLPMLLR